RAAGGGRARRRSSVHGPSAGDTTPAARLHVARTVDTAPAPPVQPSPGPALGGACAVSTVRARETPRGRGSEGLSQGGGGVAVVRDSPVAPAATGAHALKHGPPPALAARCRAPRPRRPAGDRGEASCGRRMAPARDAAAAAGRGRSW